MKDLLIKKGFLKPYIWMALASMLLGAIGIGFELLLPRLIQRIVDEGITPLNMDVVWQTALMMLGVSILSMLVSIGWTILSVRVGEGFARDLREKLFNKIQSLSFGNLDRLKTGQLVVRMTSDVAQVQLVVQILMRIGMRATLLLAGSLFFMFTTSVDLTLKILPIVFVIIVLVLIFATQLRDMFLIVQKKLDWLNTVLQENLAGVRVVKAFVRADHEKDRFGNANDDYMQQQIRVMRLLAFLIPTLMFGMNLGTVAVVWFGGLGVVEGSMTIGEIMAFVNYLMTTMVPVLMLAMAFGMIAAAGASAKRINEVLDSEPDVKEKESPTQLNGISGRVKFENVSFCYNDSSCEPVLNEINLTAEAGETVAILGATGSGKSTLVNLIPRFYDVTGGRILVDDVDIREVTKDSLLANIGMAQQETILFSGTIKDNIRYGRPEATDEEVFEAAKAAQAHEFIMSFPEGYDSPVVQRGANLSGGQKQRISIARALLVKPQILILDDSTSAVDVDTEADIQVALEELMKDRTSFVIAQRISTVLSADKIVVLDKGKISAIGNHHQLMETSPIYQEIFQSQLGNGKVKHE